MKSLTAFTCVVIVSSICHVAMSDSQIADSDAAADYYAQYYKDYYNSLEGTVFKICTFYGLTHIQFNAIHR